ncbi:N5-carboxyaminoimidazole ribonucleotide synthase [Mycobacterium tuberculosis]|nr:N5-carboxyaminoimidazole ribonucleotide synthase [Mycobacterium tuberculosis]
MSRAGDDAVGVPPACGGRSDEVGVPPACEGERRT